jgi:predicted transcriptional regulator of viral defense system
MRHLDVPYYVGWLSAAAMHGAAHHAPQVFQVAVGRHVRDRTVGRTKFRFAIRDNVTAMPTGPTTGNTDHRWALRLNAEMEADI